MNKETKIYRVNESMSAFRVTFEFHLTELSLEEKEALRTLWREGVSLKMLLEQFQNPDQTTL